MLTKTRMIKKLYKAITPPIIQSKLKTLLLKSKGYYSGPYATWECALKKASGYNSLDILEIIKNATLKVKENNTLFVRDGMVFEEPQYSYPFLAALLKIALQNSGKLTVLDFGGALGSSYYAFKCFYPQQLALQWHIIEQPPYVDCGKALFTNAEVSFYDRIESVPIVPDVIFLSACLQYISSPYTLLEKLRHLNAEYLLLDRTLFDNDKEKKNTIDQIYVEHHISDHVYKGSYPLWVLNYNKLVKYLTQYYEIIFECNAIEGECTMSNLKLVSKGVFLRRKPV